MSLRSKQSSEKGGGVSPVVLVVVDFPQPLTRALLYACRYAAKHKCRLLLVDVRPRVDMNPLLFLGRAMGKRSRAFAEQYVLEVSVKVQEWGCAIPSFSMLEGDAVEEIDKLLADGDHRVVLTVLSDKGFVDLSSSLSRSATRARAGKVGKKKGAGWKTGVFPLVVVPNGMSEKEVEDLL